MISIKRTMKDSTIELLARYGEMSLNDITKMLSIVRPIVPSHVRDMFSRDINGKNSVFIRLSRGRYALRNKPE